jgi:hypothetical protein
MFRDGPLTRRAPETIRYGTGRCALGALLVASSGRGIVSIMVRDTQSRLIRELGARFPKANLVRDEKGTKTTVAKVGRYIAAPFRPFPLPLDVRGLSSGAAHRASRRRPAVRLGRVRGEARREAVWECSSSRLRQLGPITSKPGALAKSRGVM